MREVTEDELQSSLSAIGEIAEQAGVLRKQMEGGLSAQEFAQGISALQHRCIPLVVLIAETKPSRDLQRFAMTLAMGIKGTELSLWYYLYGTMSQNAEYIQYGDLIISRAIMELKKAAEILE